jgi:methylated-DNA-protein-cysteine methyltransferase related protein
MQAEDVYAVVRLIPYGKVSTYGHIAAYLGARRSARLVGWYLNSSHSREPNLPAHRVVNRQGLLTGLAFFGTPTRMQELLEAEGIQVVDNQIVDFANKLWIPAQELL